MSLPKIAQNVLLAFVGRLKLLPYHSKESKGAFMDGVRLVKEYIDKNDWRISENANVTYSSQGLNFYLSGALVKDFWLKEVYPPKAAAGHINGQLHIHQLKSALAPYCSGWDLVDLLITGFGHTPGVITSKPPKHLSTALMQLVNFMFCIQNEACGAVAVSNWDTLLAPFVKEDKLSYEQVKQLVQEFVFHMNVPTRSGGQSPFSNITLDITPTKKMKDTPAIVGGIPQDYTYGDVQKEQQMLVRALFEIYLEGDALGRTHTFPIPTIDINGEFPYDADFLEPMWEATAKYGIPYFAGYLNTGRNRDESRSMCCRLNLDLRKINRKGGLFSVNPLTGSIGVISLNLPRIALDSLSVGNDDIAMFLSNVRDWTRESVIALREKRKFLETMTERGLYPMSRFWLRGVKEKSGKYWSQHFSTIGLIGMHEACLNLGIKDGIVSEQGHDLAKQTLDEMLKVINAPEFEDDLVNLEATPAEGSSYRLALKDLKKFGSKAHYSGPKEAPYYTGSTLYPNNADGDIVKIIEHQEDLQSKYTGGTVLHVWLGERISAGGAKAFVKKLMEETKLPYITLAPTFSICSNESCQKNGYISGEHATCPNCGSKTEIYSRVVGYLRPVSTYNPGKKAEFSERKHVDARQIPS